MPARSTETTASRSASKATQARWYSDGSVHSRAVGEASRPRIAPKCRFGFNALERQSWVLVALGSVLTVPELEAVHRSAMILTCAVRHATSLTANSCNGTCLSLTGGVSSL